ncbi:MAG: NADH-quinone oxidoreductase subunit NuoE [Neomegalonema sp.]|nr:NADH-quinone oxidoreductase subunit NuoE [Neomegalonema sp.]
MNRRLAPRSVQPASFAFTPDNQAWAQGQISKYPEGRQASAVIPLLWRAQEQEGWVSQPAIEYVAAMLDMAEIRVLEVATFYFMFKLAPVGSVAHFEMCGTTPCMLCGSEALVEVCKQKIAPHAFELSADGKFSWEEVECLGACSNAPMIQVGDDYYEDLTAESFSALIDAFARGERPRPGPQNGRFASEPLGGLTSLPTDPVHESNASVALALGTDPLPRQFSGGTPQFASENLLGKRQGAAISKPSPKVAAISAPGSNEDESDRGPVAPVTENAALAELRAQTVGRLDPALDVPTASDYTPETVPAQFRPELLGRPTDGGDDLEQIRGIGPQLGALLKDLGIYRYAQIASWTPENVAWVNAHLGGWKGRIIRDDWVAQARALLAKK